MSKHAASNQGGGRVRRVLLVLLFLVGAAIALYPAYSNLYNQYCNARIADGYQQEVDVANSEEVAAALEAARDYNEAHTVNVVADPFAQAGEGADNGEDAPTDEASDAAQADVPLDAEYEALLNIAGDGVMGYLDIPKIGQRLAVYHGTASEVLDKGVGHMHGTCLPVGGESTHCVIAGHRGLPSAALFTDLDRMQKADQFYFHILGEDIAYEVDRVQTVEPDETSSLGIVPGKDLCTLVTCTPYGVNTHRLLVTGHRVPYVAPEEPVAPLVSWLAAFTPETIAIAGALSLIVLVSLVVFIQRMIRRGKEQR